RPFGTHAADVLTGNADVLTGNAVWLARQTAFPEISANGLLLLAERDEGLRGLVVGAAAVVGELRPGLHGQPGARRVDGTVKQLLGEAEGVRSQERAAGPGADRVAERDPGDRPPAARNRRAEAVGVHPEVAVRRAGEDHRADVARGRGVDPDRRQRGRRADR